MTYQDLETAYRAGRATLPVDHINHREFVLDGVRYFAGYSSEGVTRYDPDYGCNVRDVRGWIVYKTKNEARP